jgi:phosphohistidine phosphatase
MELILWRHAQAEDGGRDLERKLTPKGHRQAAKVAKWLRARLPEKCRVLASPAMRARQTAAALAADVTVLERLAPGASAKDVLDCAGWPDDASAVTIVVGHQPTLGEVAARLIGDQPGELSVRKGAVWWFEHRSRGSRSEVVVRAVISPDLV